jgi:tyrosine-protein phosphatase YwqE
MARKARRLISAGLVDVVAGDNHGDERSLASGVEYLTEQGFPDEAHLLTTKNPRVILENGEMTSCPEIPLKASVMRALRGLLK